MITVTITKTTKREWTEKQNLVTKETPTSITKQKDYGNGTEPMMVREYAVHEINKSESLETQLLRQQIEDDSQLDLAAVIVAINKIK